MRYFLVFVILLIFSTPSVAGKGKFKIDDYRLTVFLSQMHGRLKVSGRIKGKPAASNMRISVTARSSDNRVAIVTAYARNVRGGGGSPYKGSINVSGGHRTWKIVDVKLARMR